LTLASGAFGIGSSNLTIVDNAIQGLGVLLTGGSSPQIIHNIVTPGGSGITLAGGAQNPVVEHNLVRARYADVRLTGTGATGVAGVGSLTPSDLAHANVIETSAIGVDIDGPIQFNRISRNSVGIKAHSSQLIAHNDIYQNSVGVNVQGRSDVRIFQNTIYTASGDAIDVGAASRQVEVRNNILWTGSGYDIFVANDSTSGFFSDYNDLHSSGPGKLVYWTRDFIDILDWQEDVHQFDLHSIGRTVVNPLWSQPRFASLSLDDFRIFDETA